VFGALAKAIPERVMAEGAANIWNLQFMGYDEKGDPFAYVWFSCGGTGARAIKDGLHATAFPSGISGVPAEVIEQLSPVIVYERSIRENSGGPGKYRGGCGQRLELGVRTNQPYSFSGLFDRLHHPAQGFAGGSPGQPGVVRISDGRKIESKGTLRLAPDVRITLDLPGGGGYFPASQRDPALIEQDLRNEIIDMESAVRDYGYSN
jgi:N-methylhydantoinase B